MSAFDWIVQLVYVAAASCFVLGLHLMNTPATARRGNQLSTGGMVAAIVATFAIIIHAGTITVTGWIIMLAGALLGGGAGPLGGNVAGSVPGKTIVTGNGVTVIGAGNLAASMPTAASAAYARNVTTLLLHMVADATLAIDPSDDIQAGVVITHAGMVVHPATAALLADRPAGGTTQ